MREVTCYEIILEHAGKEQEKRRLLLLQAIEKVANQMLERYQDKIAAGEITVEDIVAIGNNYLKTLLIVVLFLFSGCLHYRSRSLPEPEILEEEPVPVEKVEPKAPLQTPLPAEREAEEKLSSEDFWIVINHPKLDKLGKRMQYDLRMQWRQTCDEQDTGWYDMTCRDKVMSGMDADYFIKEGRTLDAPDTVIVMARALNEKDPRGTCEWRFRTRVEASPNVWDWSGWGELPIRLRLIDPRSLRVLETPKIDFVN